VAATALGIHALAARFLPLAMPVRQARKSLGSRQNLRIHADRMPVHMPVRRRRVFPARPSARPRAGFAGPAAAA